MTKQDILDAIRKTARENGGTPLGRGRFKNETGIGEYDIHKYWATFGKAQSEAGFTSNILQAAHSEEFLLESIVNLTRELGRFPTQGEYTVKRTKDPKFPSPGSIQRLGNKNDIVVKTSEYAMQKGYSDIVELCKGIIENSGEEKYVNNSKVNQALGEVYLYKSGRYYKIGKTCDVTRRGKELRIQLPEKLIRVHLIKTDDPSGIEAYWHKRFADKRKGGEWFDLSSADIKAFKRWKRII